MVKNLIEYRNYMPASVLVDDDDEEEVMSQDPSESGTQKSSTKEVDTRKSSNKDSKASTKASKASRSVHTRGQKPQAVQFGEGLSKRSLSMAVLGVHEWHSVVEKDTDPAGKFATFLGCLLEVYTTHKGIPETFNGDRITCSWNTVKPCAGHKVKCIDACSTIQQKVKTVLTDLGIYNGFSISAVCGDARVGNVGCQGMKKYAIKGGMVTLLYLIERIGRTICAPLLVDRWIFSETTGSFLYRAAEWVRFTKRSTKPFLVYELTGRKSASEDEWMYQLEEGEKSDPHHQWNTFVNAMVDGRLEDATASSTEMEIPPRRLERFLEASSTMSHVEPEEPKYH